MKSFQFSVFSLVSVALASVAFGQGVKITALPAATNVNDADLTVIVQSNVTKRATAALMRAGITGGTATTNAGDLTAGTLADARLSTNVALLPGLGAWAKTTNAATGRSLLGLGATNAVEFGSVQAATFGIGGELFIDESGQIYFDSDAAAERTRANLRIPWSGVTNTNAAGWRGALELGGWTTNASLTASLISDFSNSVVAVAPASTNASALTAGTLPDARLSTNVVTRATNGVAQAAAWTLFTAPTNGVATIATNEFGVGWDELGRFSVNTPVGNLSMYATGSPSTATIFWPGTIVANRFSAVFFDSTVYATNIVGGAAGGNIADSVMQASMPAILRNWQNSAAEAAGWPHVLTNAANWPVAGSYVPMGVVTNVAVDNISGEYWSLAKFRTNLFTGGGVPASGAPEGADYKNVGGQGTWVATPIYFTRQATNSPQTTNSTSVITNGVTMTISNVPAGTYTVDGLVLSDSSASREWAVIAPNNTVNPRAMLGWFGSGSASGFFGSTTNMISNADASTGQRPVVVRGVLVLTNTGIVTLTVRVSSGGTNFIQMLQDSFLRLMKVN